MPPFRLVMALCRHHCVVNSRVDLYVGRAVFLRAVFGRRDHIGCDDTGRLQLYQQSVAAAAEDEANVDGVVVACELAQQLESHRVDVCDGRAVEDHRLGGVSLVARRWDVARRQDVAAAGSVAGERRSRIDGGGEQLLLEAVDVGEVERRRVVEDVRAPHGLQQTAVPLRRVDTGRRGGGGPTEQDAPGEPRVDDDRQQAGEHADHQADGDVDERHR